MANLLSFIFLASFCELISAKVLVDREQEVYILRINREDNIPVVSLIRQKRSVKDAGTKSGGKGVPTKNTTAQLVQSKAVKVKYIKSTKRAYATPPVPMEGVRVEHVLDKNESHQLRNVAQVNRDGTLETQSMIAGAAKEESMPSLKSTNKATRQKDMRSMIDFIELVPVKAEEQNSETS